MYISLNFSNTPCGTTSPPPPHLQKAGPDTCRGGGVGATLSDGPGAGGVRGLSVCLSSPAEAPRGSLGTLASAGACPLLGQEFPCHRGGFRVAP